MPSPISAVETSRPYVDAKAIGTVIRVDTVDTNIAEVVAARFDRLVVERSTDGGVTFQEVTRPADRPALDKTQTGYVWTDYRGDASYRYRTRYYSRRLKVFSEPSESIEGKGLAIRGILTVSDLKDRYFFGIDLTDPEGKPFTEATFQHYIMTAVRWFETQLDIPIVPTTFVERHDYYRADWNQYMMLLLDNYPVIRVESFGVQWPGSSRVGYPLEWLNVVPDSGQITVVPTTGTFMDISVGAHSQLFDSGVDWVPNVYDVTYSAGFEIGRVPQDIVDVIGLFASLGPFNVFGDIVAGSGLQSVSLSMDGLSQSVATTNSSTNAGFGARIIQYLKQIKDQLPQLKRRYKRVGGMVVA